MNVIRCKNGHFFDGDTYSACPHCGEAAMTGKDSATAKEEKKSLFGRGRKEKNSVSKFVSTKTDNSVAGNYKTTVTTTEYIGIGETDNTVAAPIKESSNIDFDETFPYYEKISNDSNDEHKEYEASENNGQDICIYNSIHYPGKISIRFPTYPTIYLLSIEHYNITTRLRIIIAP